jgi:hypothetical protein
MFLGALVIGGYCVGASGAGAATLFAEDFNGYSSFPALDPFGDPVNPGLPSLAEGADQSWFGIRFDDPTSGTIDQDLAVQQFGGILNLTPVGRVEDEAGLVFQVNTIGMTSSTLDFDWRTFSATGEDRLRAGYFVGDIPAFATSNTFDARGTAWAWANWTPLLSGKNDVFQHATYALPANQASIWVAFWLDNGEGDYGKIDNVVVTAVPEPAAAVLLFAAVALLALRRRRASAP